jgi:phospholipid/cholesterol/gamma-HCH transport system substrate-binding protein
VKFRIRYAQQVVGVFVLIAAISLVLVIVSMGANQRWFAKNYSYYSIFPSGEGLSTGMAIQFKGFDIGRVTDVTLSTEDEVRVDFYIRDTYYERVVPNSILELVSNPIGLGGGLVFHQGRELADPLPEDSLIPALNTKEGQAIVAANSVLMPSSGDSITRIIGQIEPVLRNVNSLLLSVDTTLGHVNLALSGDQTEPLGLTLAQVSSLLEEVETHSRRDAGAEQPDSREHRGYRRQLRGDLCGPPRSNGARSPAPRCGRVDRHLSGRQRPPLQ